MSLSNKLEKTCLLLVEKNIDMSKLNMISVDSISIFIDNSVDIVIKFPVHITHDSNRPDGQRFLRVTDITKEELGSSQRKDILLFLIDILKSIKKEYNGKKTYLQSISKSKLGVFKEHTWKDGVLEFERFYMQGTENSLWFVDGEINILKNINVETTDIRARELSDVANGKLNLYYYISAAKIDNSDDIIKILLGYVSERFNEYGYDLNNINHHIPAQYMNKYLSLLSEGKVNKKHQKDIIDYLITTKFEHSPDELFEILLSDPKYKVIDNSVVSEIIDKIIKENEKAVEDARLNPKKIGFLIGKIKSESNGQADLKVATEILKEKLNID